MNKLKATLILLGFGLLFLSAACKKKVAAVPPPPPPPVTKEAPPAPPKPVISVFAATPSSIDRGQSSNLRWSVSNANNITIEPSIGSVQSDGSRQIFPSSNTTYTLTAKGPGGTADETASVSVTIPAPAVAAAPRKSLGDLLAAQTKDAYFDYDKSNLRPDARANLTQDATALKEILKDFSTAKVTVEGHCDERGSAEYNLALGDRRAREARDFLVEFGVPSAQLATISYGKEHPQCTEHNEECWQKNRRAHLSASE
ncbi:MAG TPA: OmpA family protein [Bryobacteraceae bacterium]|nr:OmpA family protein [Bryobacteraceae bacterium]